jgi:hypothetical protein
MHRVPLYVAVNHKPKRKRDFELAFFLHSFDIDIRELQSSEAPVVAEGRMVEDGDFVTWREIDGSYWRPILDTGSFGRNPANGRSFLIARNVLTERVRPAHSNLDDPFSVATILGARPPRTELDGTFTYYTKASHAEPFTLAFGKPEDGDFLEPARRSVARTALDLTLVDGVLHRRSEPPMLIVRERQETRIALPATGSWRQDLDEGLVEGWLIPLSQSRLASDLLSRLDARPTSGSPEGFPPEEKPVIDASHWGSMPTLETADGLQLHLRALEAEWRSDSMKYVKLGSLPTRLFAPVGAVMAGARPQADDDTIEAGTAAVAEIASFMSPARRFENFGPLSRLLDAADAAGMAIDVLRDRTIETSMEEEPALAMGL